MVSQGVLPYIYEAERHTGGATALGGLPAYADLLWALGVPDSIQRNVRVRRRRSGWSERELVGALVLLQLAGGEGVEDIRTLGSDEGFCRLMERLTLFGVKRRERRRIQRLWKRGRRRSFPSATSIHRFLEVFHDPGEMERREPGKAWVPRPNAALSGLHEVNWDLVSAVQRRSPLGVATLDMDATLVETHKREALFSYKGYRAYQPLNTWWAEQGLVVSSEFRDGNVPAQSRYLRMLEDVLGHLPEGVRTVRLRSDTAGYQHELLRYCERGKSRRFGRIEFAVGADMTQELRSEIMRTPEAQWRELPPRGGMPRRGPTQEWAEICFVPNWVARSKKGRYRFLAVREPLEQQALPGMEGQLKLPFPTAQMGTVRYKVTAVVTNLDWDGDRVIHWYRERCGKSEEAHAIMKNDLAGGRLPSYRFGSNAAWWAITILALNLNEAMKRLVLSRVKGAAQWVNARFKTLRFHLMNIPGRVIRHGRRLVIKIAEDHPSLSMLVRMRAVILDLAGVPPG